METAAVSGPKIDGVNVTVMLQLPPDGTTVPQFCAMLKSDALGPVVVIVASDRNAVPVFLNVIVCCNL